MGRSIGLEEIVGELIGVKKDFLELRWAVIIWPLRMIVLGVFHHLKRRKLLIEIDDEDVFFFEEVFFLDAVFFFELVFFLDGFFFFDEVFFFEDVFFFGVFFFFGFGNSPILYPHVLCEDTTV